MRLEGGAGMPLRLIAPSADLRALDAAFSELLQHATVDDWQIRTGATREELDAVWTGIAASRVVQLSDEDAVTVAVSERAIEVLDAVVFELARARGVPAADLEQRTGTAIADWRRVHAELAAFVAELDVGSVTPHVAPPDPFGPLDPLGPVAGHPPNHVRIERFRYAGIALAGVRLAGIALELGDARAIELAHSSFDDVACRGVRLISSHLSDVDVSGTLNGCAVIDCDLEGVSFTGTLSDVRFVGGSYTDVDLRSAHLAGCRFYEACAGEGLYLPDGRDCFVVPVASVERAFEPLRPRVGAETFRALCEWAASEEADYATVVPAFWKQLVARGAHADVEVESEVMARLFRLRAASIGSMPPAS